LVPGNCHPLKADRAGQFAMRLWGPQRLVFEPAEDPVPLTVEGQLDLREIRLIRILDIEDYHDD
jgi:proteic killer suppression protein